MGTSALYSKFDTLPEHLKKQVLDYIEFLMSREPKGQQPVKPGMDQSGEGSPSPKPATKKPLKAGFLKGSFVMAADFDEPLDDFKEYMP